MRIPRDLYDQMIEHARAGGAERVLSGCSRSRNGTAEKLYGATNAAASPLRFEIEGSEQIRYHSEIEDSGLELGAIYHSHTRTEPVPRRPTSASPWGGPECCG